jgi:hypothetical protein
VSCNCHGPNANTGVAAIKKKPCGPCAQAAAAIASATPPHTFHGVGAAATTDLTTIQTFLQSLTPNSPPTQADITSAQEAAADLSNQVFAPPTPAGSTTIPTSTLILGGAAVAIAAASLAYLYADASRTPVRRRAYR